MSNSTELLERLTTIRRRAPRAQVVPDETPQSGGSGAEAQITNELERHRLEFAEAVRRQEEQNQRDRAQAEVERIERQAQERMAGYSTAIWGDNPTPRRQTPIAPPAQTRTGISLTPVQKIMLTLIEKDRKKLYGARVRLVRFQEGNWRYKSDWSQGIIKGIVLSKDLQQTIFDVAFDTGERFTCEIWTIELLDPEKYANKRTLNSVFISRIREMIEEKLNTNLTHYQKELQSVHSEVEKYERYLKDYQKREATLQATIDKIKVDPYPIEKFKQEIEEIKKHDKVEDAYISTAGNIVVITKDLQAIDNDTDEEKDFVVGKFVFNISYRGGMERPILVRNIKYEYDDHGHPNITNHTEVCWGDHQSDIYNMFDKGELYQLVDFMITFFSIYPHDEDAEPYMDYSDWLEERYDVEDKDTVLLERKI